jgi:hypothetical protein
MLRHIGVAEHVVIVGLTLVTLEVPQREPLVVSREGAQHVRANDALLPDATRVRDDEGLRGLGQ